MVSESMEYMQYIFKKSIMAKPEEILEHVTMNTYAR